MYTYEFEHVSTESTDWGLFKGMVYESPDCREIIRRRAAEGWRYVGFLPVRQRGTGDLEEYDLVFEKEVSE